MSTIPRNNRRRKTSLLSKARWAGYAAAGAATALGTYEAAEAGVWYSGVLNGGLGVRMNAVEANNVVSYKIDLPGNFDGSGNPITDDLAMFHSKQVYNGTYQYGAAVANSIRTFNADKRLAKIAGVATSGGALYNATRFAKDSPIFSASREFNYFGTLASGGLSSLEFLPPGEGYVGFSFEDNGDTRYGWLRVIMDGGPINSYTIMDYAYAGAGENINAGQVPEPGSLGLLATGGIGLLLWRKRRSNRKSA